MTRQHTDYVYRNKSDTVRVRVFRRASSRWDYDVFYPSSVTTYSDETGADFRTKSEALASARAVHGPLYAVTGEGTVVDEAWRSKASQAHSSKKFVTISVASIHREEDEDEDAEDENNEDADLYIVSDDGGEFDDSEETPGTEVQSDIDDRRLTYRKQGRVVVLDIPSGRNWR